MIEWRTMAACRDHPTAWWFPDRPATTESIAGVVKAKAICAGCPVDLECLVDAIAPREQYGIRGGLVPRRLSALVRAADRRVEWRIAAPRVGADVVVVAAGSAVDDEVRSGWDRLGGTAA